jgi:hypothetical protein
MTNSGRVYRPDGVRCADTLWEILDIDKEVFKVNSKIAARKDV